MYLSWFLMFLLNQKNTIFFHGIRSGSWSQCHMASQMFLVGFILWMEEIPNNHPVTYETLQLVPTSTSTGETAGFQNRHPFHP